ncbi:MAG: CehA/McbA family metallohydrolase [Pyrinomonadaceae bacterium]|nr:CehA/McbA family metallohydrolase [Pyrinomonadaceae bacterium]
MKAKAPFWSIVISLLFALSIVGQSAAPGQLRWYRGNTHTHTFNSDGDWPPDDVAKWYRQAGYQFLFITDHEYITDVEPLNSVIGKPGVFLVISGQEVTDRFESKPYHINGLGIPKVVRPNGLNGAVETLQKNIDDVRAAGGVPQLNHPNFGWALTANDILRLKNVRLMEVYNAHPLVNNMGGGGSASTEQIWDDLLSGGMVIYGIADDDAHTYTRPGDTTKALPGQAWIYVRAAELTRDAILKALDNGDFYGSTGVELEDYTADAAGVRLKIKEARGSKYRVEFIGKGGRVLATQVTNPAAYKFKGDEGYVRAKIYESNGKFAFTQPVFVGR